MKGAGKETGVGAKAMDRGREVCRENWDTQTTLISHIWRGSMLTVRRVGQQHGKKGKGWREVESWAAGLMLYASSGQATSRPIFRWQIAIEVLERKRDGRREREGKKRLEGRRQRKVQSRMGGAEFQTISKSGLRVITFQFHDKFTPHLPWLFTLRKLQSVFAPFDETVGKISSFSYVLERSNTYKIRYHF